MEYCLSAQAFDDIHFFVSRMDRETYVIVMKADDILSLLTEKR